MTPFKNNQSKDLKPIVKVPAENAAFGKKTYQQGDMNNSPVTKVAPSLSPFKMPTNGVTNADSSRLQDASKLPGRVSDGPCEAPFC